MDRNALLLGDATKASRIIEIGPSHAPIAAKRAGWRTTVVDHASAEDLREKYATFPVDLAAIEHVDHIWAGGRLDRAVPAAEHGTFDRLIASHVIEHIPDFVSFFAAAEILLTPSGALALAVPDKRYCFDALKPVTTTGDILAAHDPNGAGRHARRTMFNQVAYSVGMDGNAAWGQHPVARASFMNPLTDAIATWRAASEAPDSPYVDAHAWQFTPSAFRLAILELAEAGLIDWRVTECSPAAGSEFIVTLRRGRAAWHDPAARDAHRLTLLLDMLVELREQVDYAARGGLIHLPDLATDPAVATGLDAMRDVLSAQRDRLADLTDRLTGQTELFAVQQRQLDAQQQQFDSMAQQVAALHQDLIALQQALPPLADQLGFARRQLDSITGATGTQAAILGFLTEQKEAARQDRVALATALAALNDRLAQQDARLAEIGTVAHWVRRILAPFHRLHARLRRRPPA